MAYLGSKPASNFITTAKQRVTSSTNNYVDLDHAISTLADVIVWVNYVKQDATNLSLTTSTRITLGGTLTSSDVVEIAYLGKAVATQNPSDNSVTNDMLTGSIAQAKLSDEVINEAKLQVSNAPTNGYMLTAQSGNTGGLTWAEAPSGGLVHLNTSTITSNTSAMTIDNVFTSTYDNYMVIGDMTSNGNSNPQFHFRSTAPATITNSNYKYGFAGCKENGNAVTNAQNGNSKFEFATQLYNSNQIDPPSCWFQFFFNSPQIASTQRTFTGSYGVWKENGNIETYSGAGFLTLNTACGGLRFSMSANDINNATVRVYGLVNT